MTGLAIADTLRTEVINRPGFTVTAVPVDTPAGGLIRVVDGSTGETLLDKSYVRGTAACSLEEKLRWKLSPAETRGPPPFKGKPLPVPMENKLKELASSLDIDSDLSIVEAEKKRELQIKQLKDKGQFEDFLECEDASLPEKSRGIQTAALLEDRTAVAEVEMAVKESLNLK